MALNKPYLLTPDGLEKLREELHHLRTDKREDVAARLQLAIEDGQDDDFVDNAELEAVRNDQSFLEGRIIEIEDMLRNYKLIEDANSDTVYIGSWVTVVEDGEEDEERYYIVGAAEANPSEGRISNESLLGSALLGAKKGDSVRYTAPGGDIEFKVIKIE